ncbi:glycosyltransferase family 4 protein [Methanococcus maripaludis]|uniref:Glycosyltransferase involved in cell wall biosynthesis n=1 Tax=Methanococcus maripaludis TaxID=39152 RepID=A0A7J9RZT6_METMI|nr:glycosyltransferase family 4 protein [Methanococcus maripaludis]MBB6066838.1 glycosyltransferase involved in cell wall biosynthesis [Methanococcus maripaludis]
MKIIEFNDYISKVGGAEEIFKTSIELLDKNNEIFTMSFDNGDLKNHIYLKNDNFIIKLINKYLFNPFLYLKIKKICNDVNPDVIHIHNINCAPITILMAIKNHKIAHTVHSFGIVCPISWCIHKSDNKPCNGSSGLQCLKHCVPKYGKRGILLAPYLLYFKLIQHLKRRYITKYITPSKKLNEIMVCNGFKNIITINNPSIPHKTSEITEECLKKSFETKTILYVGKMVDLKGVRDYFENIQNNTKYNFVFVGDGQLLEELRTSNKNPNIKFLGVVDHKNIYKIYKESSIVIVPSKCMDNFPTTILESKTHGKPVIAKNIGGIPEMITGGHDGILFENFSEIPEKIDKIMENYTIYQNYALNSSKSRLKFGKEKYLNKLINELKN